MIHRNALITSGTMAAILIAGGAVTALSLGVLDQPQPTELGNASAISPLSAPETTTPLAAETVGTELPPETRGFRVGDAGVVTLERRGVALAVIDVRANDGWQSESRQIDAGSVGVTLTDGTTTVEFLAHVEGGSIVVDSTETVASSTGAPSARSVTPGAGIAGNGGVEIVAPRTSDATTVLPATVPSFDDHDDHDDDYDGDDGGDDHHLTVDTDHSEGHDDDD